MRARSPGSPSSSAMSVLGRKTGRAKLSADSDRLPPRLATNVPDQTDALSMSMLRLADEEIERVWVSKTAIEKELRLTLVAKDAEIRKLKQNVGASEAAIEALNKTVQQLQQEFLTLRAAADETDITAVLKKLRLEMLAKDNEVRAGGFARDDAFGKLNKLQKTLEEALAHRDRLTTELEAARRTIDFRIPELESANAAYLADKEELEAALNLKQTEIHEFRASEARLSAELSGAQLKLKNRAKLAFDQELAASVAASKAVTAAKASELEKSNKTVKYLESELTALKTEHLGFFESEKTRLERKVAELTRLYEEEAARGLANVDKANKTDTLEAELRTAHEVYDKTVRDFQSQVGELKTELDRLTAENQVLTSKCAKLEEYERIFQSSELHSVLRTLSSASSGGAGANSKRRP